MDETVARALGLARVHTWEPVKRDEYTLPPKHKKPDTPAKYKRQDRRFRRRR